MTLTSVPLLPSSRFRGLLLRIGCWQAVTYVMGEMTGSTGLFFERVSANSDAIGRASCALRGFTVTGARVSGQCACQSRTPSEDLQPGTQTGRRPHTGWCAPQWWPLAFDTSDATPPARLGRRLREGTRLSSQPPPARALQSRVCPEPSFTSLKSRLWLGSVFLQLK